MNPPRRDQPSSRRLEVDERPRSSTRRLTCSKLKNSQRDWIKTDNASWPMKLRFVLRVQLIQSDDYLSETLLRKTILVTIHDLYKKIDKV